MAENIFQSIRGAQFRGSRFPGFRSTGQQADSGVDPVTAELAAQNRDSWTGPRPTALNTQSFGGSDFSASTAPAGEPAPDGGARVASAVRSGIDAITPSVSTTGDRIAAVGRGVGAIVGGVPGLAISGASRVGGEIINADDYNDRLESRGLDRSVSAGRAAGNSLLAGLTLNIANNPANTSRGQFDNAMADAIRAGKQGGLIDPEQTQVEMQDRGVQSWTGDNVTPGQAARSQSTTGVGNPEDTGSLFGGGQNQGQSMADPFSTPEGDPYGGVDPNGGSTPGGGGEPGSSVDGSVGGGSGEVSDGGAPGGFAKGGHVTRDRLTGPNPPGPDDGYAPLDVGETVITAEATRRYGKDVMMALNKGLVSREAVRRLLG